MDDGTDRRTLLRDQLALTRQLAEIVWPGAAAGVDELRRLLDRWDAFLASRTEAELDAGGVVTFPFDDGRPLVAIAGWANVELTKNVAEMGVLRRLAEAG
ncbi:hypothetical protein PHK61_21045 [Actinomycetospora lutea]|uniref:hypothetical protein n=1 Tax=Actinomycetospora lutea TaxID=663604 RepID=UPI0023653195|nr:hypothetical protein [Actinomycetospora lutea]MDD7940911.1 hypothetical protein [Actinomycetospora lutea]